MDPTNTQSLLTALSSAPPPSVHSRTLKWLLACMALLLAGILGLITLVLTGAETGLFGLIAGMSLAILPVPLYVTMALWVDRFEPEPPWLLGAAFIWGATVAVFFAGIINGLGEAVVEIVTGSEAVGSTFAAVISAPIVEESLKGMAVFIIFFWQKRQFDDVIDGIVYATMVALGFAMAENFQYYGKAVHDGLIATIATFGTRGLLAPYTHPLFTCMTGIGLGWARITKRTLIKFTAPLLGLLMAMWLHFCWNGSLILFGNLIISYVLLLPTFIGIAIVVVFSLKREESILRAQLLCDLQSGNLSQSDYEALCSVRGRLRSSFAAWRAGGHSALRARRRFNRMASELAFQRQRNQL